MKIYTMHTGRRNGKTAARRIRTRAGLWLWKLRYDLSGTAYRLGLYKLSRRLNRSAYWAAYAAELGAAWCRGERLPEEQEAHV